MTDPIKPHGSFRALCYLLGHFPMSVSKRKKLAVCAFCWDKCSHGSWLFVVGLIVRVALLALMVWMGQPAKAHAAECRPGPTLCGLSVLGQVAPTSAEYPATQLIRTVGSVRLYVDNGLGLGVWIPMTQPGVGAGGGGVAQTQVRSGANIWTDVGYFAGNLNMPVAVQGTVPVSGTFWQATQPISGTVGLSAGSAVIGHTISDSGSTTAVTGTVAVSAASLPLPAGASQDSTLTSGAARVQLVDANANAVGVARASPVYVYVVSQPPPLNPFLQRCNAVRRSNCQP